MTAKRVGTALALLLLYVAFAILFTYPLAWFFGTHHVGEEGGDARVYLWNLWWVDQALTELHTNPFETDFIFYPLGIGLSLHTLGFSQGLLFIPMKLLLGEVAAANAVVLWTFVASALGMYALARYLGASALGAFLAGLAFAFCPYRLARLAGHYDLLSTEWVPLYALVFLKAVRAEKHAWALVLGAAALAAACGYATLTYLVFLGLWSFSYLLWEALRGERPSRLMGATAGIALLTVALLLPLLVQVRADLSSWSYPTYPGSDRYGANLAAYAVPGPQQNLLGESLGRRFDRNLTESTVFPGYLMLSMLIAAIAHPPVRRHFGFWIAAAGVFLLLSLGDTLKVGGWESGIPLPFALLRQIPLLDQMRAPSRFSILFVFCGAAVLAATWSSWMERIPRRAWRVLLTAGAAGILVAEYLTIPVPVFGAAVAPVYHQIADENEDYTVVEIPGIEQVAGRIMYHQTVHGKRILIGTAARIPREKVDYYFGLPLIRPLVDLRRGRISLTPELIEEQRNDALRVASFLDLRYFIIDPAYAKRGVVDFLEQVLPVERFQEDKTLVVLRVRAEELPVAPNVIDPGSSESRMYFESGWSRPEEAEGRRFRWANAPHSTILLRRPTEAVRYVVLSIAPLEPSAGSSLEVAARLDGSGLGTTTLPSGWTELRLALPERRERKIERLVLLWSDVRRASEDDPRRLAARVSSIWFE
ncbi:MAG TPA: hypothetical protein VGC53_01040 [Vicinamibacteria bacterium]|jgi:hypothetical protein